MIVVETTELDTRRVFRTMGTDPVRGVVGCGFERKHSDADSHRNALFSHYALVLLLQGSGAFIDSRGNEYPLKPGSVFQRIPGHRHSSIVDVGSGWLEFWAVLGEPLYRSLGELHCLRDEEVFGVPPDLIDLDGFSGLVDLLEQADHRGLPAALNSILSHIFMLSDAAETDQWRDSSVDRVRTLIEESCCRRISMPELAETAGMSYSTLRRRFKSEVGISPSRYRINCRINKARAMLADKQIAIQSIAESLGYPDQFSFSKQFRMIMGTSPLEYRDGL